MQNIHTNVPRRSIDVRNEYRGGIDLLRRRVHLLTGKDKLLLTMYLEKGNSFRQIAQLAGVNEAKIARRIRKVMRRLIGNEYITCLRNQRRFTELEMTVAKDYFLRGLPIKQIAASRQITYYRVRQILKRIQKVLRTIRPQERAKRQSKSKQSSSVRDRE